MFINPDELLEVEVMYKSIGRQYLVFSRLDFHEAQANQQIAIQKIEKEKNKYPDKTFAKIELLKEEDFKTLKVQMKVLNWKLYNELQDNAMLKDVNGEQEWSYRAFKEGKLAKLVISWDATSISDGKLVTMPVNEKNILNLAPDIAEAILNIYDQISVLDEDDSKK